MNGYGQSDRFVVPANPLNKAAAAEAGEERKRTVGNTDSETCSGRSAGESMSSDLDRVRQVAVKDKNARFTALLHHVSVPRLMMAFEHLNPRAAPGVDGVTWQEYGRDLVANLRDLHGRVQSGRYRASPSRRVYVPKADGRLRPLGIASLEDKIVQRAVTGVLNAVYEADFLGFSYGFRPGRSPHDALDALTAGIYRKKVSWVLDADIRDFLDPWSYCSFADFQVQKSPSCVVGTSIRRPFLRPARVRTARSSPRLTFCNTVWRETPSARLAWCRASHPSGALSVSMPCS